jgi:hypothetical protein
MCSSLSDAMGQQILTLLNSRGLPPNNALEQTRQG